MELIWFWLTVVAILAGSLVSLATRRKKKLPLGPKWIPIWDNYTCWGRILTKTCTRLPKTMARLCTYNSDSLQSLLFHLLRQLSFSSRHTILFLPADHLIRLLNIWHGVKGIWYLGLAVRIAGHAQAMHLRRNELGYIVESLKEASRLHTSVDLSAMVASLTADMSCRMVFSKKYDDKDIGERGFKAVIQEAMKLSVVPDLGDYFPFLGVLDLQGLTRKMKVLAKVFNDFFEKVIEDHVRAGDHPEQAKDIVYTMMSIMQSGECEFLFDRRHVKAIMLVSTWCN